MKKLTPNPYVLLVAGLALLALVVRFAYALNLMLGGLALLGLMLGWKRPDTFRPLFKEKTSKSVVCWSFGGLFMVTAVFNSVLEPKTPRPIMTAPVTTAVAPENKLVPKPQPATTNPQGATAKKTTSSQPQAPLTIKASTYKKAVRKTQAKLSAQETIRGLMEEQFGDRLREVEVSAAGGGSYRVKVEFDRSLRLTGEATKDYMEGDMQDAYRAIFTSGVKVVEAQLEAFGSGTDKFGKRFRSPAYHTALDGEVAAQVDWSNYRAARWDELWTVVFLHPNYQKQSSKTSIFERVELKARVSWGESGIQLLNDNLFDWDEVKIYVNPTFGLGGGYSVPLGTLRLGEERFIPYSELATHRGERFDPVTTKILRIKVACQTPEGAAIAEFKAE